MKCYLCDQTNFTRKPGKVRDKPELEVLECSNCGLVFLSSFSHATEALYEDSGMHAESIDVESWSRQTARDDERRFASLQRLLENKDVLDFGCGNGGFLKQARRVAKSVAGVELEKRLQPYFAQAGLQVFPNAQAVEGRFDVITLFHVLEHIPDPILVLQNLREKLTKGGQLIIEVPSAADALLNLYKSEPFSRFTYWSCHLYLFTPSTLAMLAQRAGLKTNYIKQVQRYPLSNHLLWLAQGRPGGHCEWSFLDSEELHHAYEKSLAAIGQCDTILASFS